MSATVVKYYHTQPVDDPEKMMEDLCLLFVHHLKAEVLYNIMPDHLVLWIEMKEQNKQFVEESIANFHGVFKEISDTDVDFGDICTQIR